jgi:hypothetical protein
LILNPGGGNSPKSSFFVWKSFARVICAPTSRNLSSGVTPLCMPLKFLVGVMYMSASCRKNAYVDL